MIRSEERPSPVWRLRFRLFGAFRGTPARGRNAELRIRGDKLYVDFEDQPMTMMRIPAETLCRKDSQYASRSSEILSAFAGRQKNDIREQLIL